MGNIFRDPYMRSTYDAMVTAYREKRPLLFHKDGTPHRGNGWAGEFWNGYNGVVPNWDRASKKMASYPVWCAGRDIGAKERK
jgi:hypothetical protein